MRLGILTSHPVQYHAPWFRALARVASVEVFYAHRQTAEEQGRAGFGVAFDWDVDLLSGYAHRFLRNVARRPGVNHYNGCDTPEIAEIIGARAAEREGTPAGAGADDPAVAGRGTGGGRRFDAFLTMGWYLKAYWQGARVCRRAGIPVLVRCDSQLQTPRPLLKRLVMEVWQRRRLREFNGFLSVGVRNREYLEHFGVPPERIFFVPHFVDTDWFAAKAAAARARRAEIRAGWGAGERHRVILFVGKFIRQKRPEDLLRAVKRMRDHGQNHGEGPVGPARSQVGDLVVVYVGSGELEGELRRFAAREKLRAHFAGFKNQSELPGCYAAADVLVLPSESETWGLVVNEAMACGIPAIVSDAVGCAPDLIEEGRTGFTFPVGDVAALAERLRTLARLRARGHDFGPALREKMERYSVQTAVRGTLEAVERLRRLCSRGRDETGGGGR